jgi:hypothetical protein
MKSYAPAQIVGNCGKFLQFVFLKIVPKFSPEKENCDRVFISENIYHKMAKI